MASKTEYTLDDLSCLGITSPSIQMDDSDLNPGCSLQNGNTTLVNFRDATMPGESHSTTPYRFHGTRSTSAIAGTQYWQVKVEMDSAAVASLVNNPTFIQFGVATLTVLDDPDPNTLTDFSFMVKLGLLSEPKKENEKMLEFIIRITHKEKIDIVLFSIPRGQCEGMQCTCGILVNSAMKRVTILDTREGMILCECSFQNGDLYAAFNILELKDSVGGEIKLSVETGEHIRLSRQLAGLLAKAVESDLSALDEEATRSTEKDVGTVALAEAAVSTRKETPSSNAKTNVASTGKRGTADNRTATKKRKGVASAEARDPLASGSAPPMDVNVADQKRKISAPRTNTSRTAFSSSSNVKGRSQRGRGVKDRQRSEGEERASRANKDLRRSPRLEKLSDKNEAQFQNVQAKKPRTSGSPENV